MKVIIQTPTPNLEASINFYQTSGYELLSKASPTLFSDGTLLIEINPERYARAGVKLYRDNWKSTVETLMEHTAVTPIKNGYLLADTSNTWIYLLEGTGPDQEPTDEFNCIFGNSMGLSLETTDIARSAAIWQALGLTKSMGSPEQGWVTYNSEALIISLMTPNTCPHLFFNPSFTFFNGKEGNPNVIQKVRELGIPITEEITHFSSNGEVDNIIIRDPGGFGFFLFND